MLSEEEWRHIPGTDNYFVSTYGRIKKVSYLKPRYYRGRGMVDIRINGKRQNKFIHSLVAQLFLGERPDGLQVNHIDGDKGNNRVDNLEYVTQLENLRHAYALGIMNPGGKKPRKIEHPSYRRRRKQLAEEGKMPD